MRFEFVWELRIRLALAGGGAASSSSSSSPAPTIVPPANSVADKYVQHVSLEIVEIAFGPSVPPQNKDKILGGILHSLLLHACTIDNRTLTPSRYAQVNFK